MLTFFRTERTDRRTDGRSATLNAAPKEGRVMLNTPLTGVDSHNHFYLQTYTSK